MNIFDSFIDVCWAIFQYFIKQLNDVFISAKTNWNHIWINTNIWSGFTLCFGLDALRNAYDRTRKCGFWIRCEMNASAKVQNGIMLAYMFQFQNIGKRDGNTVNTVNISRSRQNGNISQTTFWNVFSSIEMYELRLKLCWWVFLWVKLTIL